MSAHGCDECERANGPGGRCRCGVEDEPEVCTRCGGPVVWGAGPSCANGCEDEAPEPAPEASGDQARAMLSRLVEGSRFEVQRRGWGWVLVRVTHIDTVIPGAGTLFEGEPERRLYVERITADGSRGGSWQHDERDAVRLVEVGLFE